MNSKLLLKCFAFFSFVLVIPCFIYVFFLLPIVRFQSREKQIQSTINSLIDHRPKQVNAKKWEFHGMSDFDWCGEFPFLSIS